MHTYRRIFHLALLKYAFAFLEVELLHEILGSKYNKTIEKCKEQNLSHIFHMVSEKMLKSS